MTKMHPDLRLILVIRCVEDTSTSPSVDSKSGGDSIRSDPLVVDTAMPHNKPKRVHRVSTLVSAACIRTHFASVVLLTAMNSQTQALEEQLDGAYFEARLELFTAGALNNDTYCAWMSPCAL